MPIPDLTPDSPHINSYFSGKMLHRSSGLFTFKHSHGGKQRRKPLLKFPQKQCAAENRIHLL